ncbi:MAG: AP2 domain-containing protein [Clostridiales bacterium]|nr:AP2 domain-containing protein [Candidatus Apopatousia equi]
MKNDLTGRRFGRLTVKFVCGKSNDRHYLWYCLCDCGNKVIVPSNSLKTGHTQSCGCLQKDRTSASRTKHGAVGNHQNTERLYNVWLEMRQRCNNPNNKNFKYYGGKGVSVCDEWNDYFAFKHWAENNGYDKNAKRGDCTIDRINPNGNYEPSNCRWVDMATQNRNKAKMDNK